MSKKLQVLIASDHAAVDLKATLQKELPQYDWKDLGPYSADRVDYPDYAEQLSEQVAADEKLVGILLCGSGIGMCIAANKIHGIRAALVETPASAKLSREHNNANVLCLGARILAPAAAVEIVRTWLETPFTEDKRHIKRIEKITALENRRK